MMMNDEQTISKGTGMGVSIQIQSILYQMDKVSIFRALESIARSADLGISGGTLSSVTVAYGDTSPERCLSDDDLAEIRREFGWALQISYTFFDKNLGSARGHNTLAEAAGTDYLLILNPDVVLSPRLLATLVAEFDRPRVGMVEAKQLPIEHPKDYDPKTGETGWATTACALTPLSLFRKLDGFDADSFFLYCDDVDYSWRVREAGMKVIFAPHAIVFHDKRVSSSGAWQPSGAEQRYSAEAALMMAHKWSRPDMVSKISEIFRKGGVNEQAALQNYEAKKLSNHLPAPRDAEHRIAEFQGYLYTNHRYRL